MPKFTFTCEYPDFIKKGNTLSKITVESNREYMDDVVEDFQDFLRGCGYSFDGVLTVVDQEDEPINIDLSDSLTYGTIDLSGLDVNMGSTFNTTIGGEGTFTISTN